MVVSQNFAMLRFYYMIIASFGIAQASLALLSFIAIILPSLHSKYSKALRFIAKLNWYKFEYFGLDEAKRTDLCRSNGDVTGIRFNQLLKIL